MTFTRERVNLDSPDVDKALQDGRPFVLTTVSSVPASYIAWVERTDNPSIVLLRCHLAEEELTGSSVDMDLEHVMLVTLDKTDQGWVPREQVEILPVD